MYLCMFIALYFFYLTYALCIMDNLKKQPQFSGPEKLHELKDFALRFEEKYYTAATSQADYMQRISLKLLGIENRSANPMPNSLQSNATCDSGTFDYFPFLGFIKMSSCICSSSTLSIFLR
ncbi:putative coactivator CBP, KIX domain superfamily, mediator complex subunit 15, KIX [Helianthus annuus]|nr:putative coactivator CBP, KIX domain superfamily, mediator complex subunit 15, KIX [Helianthus annuus]KAJ0479378.1 putative coactivator CBP, KIX domain superfamily, mediator complex subunit 15, KIX [Helianthus annuus]KAJ0662340.1 putative coactivator CBP, KIX domain superfamily, mediator complex subunit 15, KIX [Helianthus annuus]KAJ0669866.1 putative coactivator CBP, KIX domain superfamily, mediator complex subunit 15, KIX [Helianthus annuus]KAJ0847642.1 putative mediator complex subunit 15